MGASGVAGSGRVSDAASAAPRSNSDVWPLIRSRCVACAARTASSRPSRICCGWPNALSAPTLASASSTLRLHRRRSIRVQKSVSDVNGPPSSRAAMIDSMALSPTFLTASRPNRIASPSTVNSSWLEWTSGGRTSMPSRRHSAIGRRDLLLVASGTRSGRWSCTRPCSSPSCRRSGTRSGRSRWHGPC